MLTRRFSLKGSLFSFLLVVVVVVVAFLLCFVFVFCLFFILSLSFFFWFGFVVVVVFVFIIVWGEGGRGVRLFFVCAFKVYRIPTGCKAHHVLTLARKNAFYFLVRLNK